MSAVAAPKVPPLTRKAREFLRREQDILDAALALFARPDWETVTVNQIAEQADIGKGTVYKHFASKEAIYARIALAFNQKLLQEFHSIDHGQPVDEILRAVIHHAFQVFLTSPAQARVAFYCKRGDFVERLDSDLQAAFVELDQAFNAFICQVLETGMTQGVFPRLPHEHLTVGLEATFDGAMSMIWNGEIGQGRKLPHAYVDIDRERFIRLVSDYMIAGLKGLAHTASKEHG